MTHFRRGILNVVKLAAGIATFFSVEFGWLKFCWFLYRRLEIDSLSGEGMLIYFGPYIIASIVAAILCAASYLRNCRQRDVEEKNSNVQDL